MTDIAFEDSKLRLMLHNLTNCQQALYGYCELGEMEKARAIAIECRATLAEIIAEIETLGT